MMNDKQKELGNILAEFDVTQYQAHNHSNNNNNKHERSSSLSHSLSSQNNAFAEVTSFLNIDTKPTTLFQLKKEFTSHANIHEDIKLDNDNDYVLQDDDISEDEELGDDMYQKEQFLTFIHSGDTMYDLSSDDRLPSMSPNIVKQYSVSRLSKNILNPYSSPQVHAMSPSPSPRVGDIISLQLNENQQHGIDEKTMENDDIDPNLLDLNNISSQPHDMKSATSVPQNVFADPTFVCSKNKQRVNWKFGFVKVNAQWRPEFIDVIKFKQFNFQTAANKFRNGSKFKLPQSHHKWKNIYWFFDNRTEITKSSQKNATYAIFMCIM